MVKSHFAASESLLFVVFRVSCLLTKWVLNIGTHFTIHDQCSLSKLLDERKTLLQTTNDTVFLLSPRMPIIRSNLLSNFYVYRHEF